jgi:hypothetical protein
MPRHLLLIASRHSAVAGALHQYIDLLFPNGELGHRTEHLGFSSSAELFEKLDGYAPEQLRETMVVFDLCAEDGSSWEVSNMWFERGLAAQLLMSYPEVYFVFLYETGSSHDPFVITESNMNDRGVEIILQHHFVRADCLYQLVELIQHHGRGFRMIFDATGLRSLIKQRLLSEVGGIESSIYEPLLRSRRDHFAAVVDEESAFVYLNGYVAYQAGFCSWLLGTWSEFRRVLRCDPAPERESNDLVLTTSTRATGPEAFKVMLSDWDLAFPDLPGGTAEQRLLLTEGLFRNIDGLILITSFKDEYQQELLAKHQGFREVKPYGGMFKLLTSQPPQSRNPLKDRYESAWAGILKDNQNSGRLAKIWSFLRNSLSKSKKNSERATTATTGSGSKTGSPNKISHHSAPHARSVVANRLLSRARLFKAYGELSTENAVHMALLAGEAKEILGGMSRTTAYEALSLQNEAEVSAEVSFLGMSARVEVSQRLSKLKQEGKVVHNTQSSGGLTASDNKYALRESQEAHLNFLLQAVKNLRLRFTAHEQMEASEECLQTFAEYHYKLMPWGRGPLDVLRKMFEGYLIKATKSGTSVLQLLGYCCVWIVVFGLIYFALLLFHIGFMAQRNSASAGTDGSTIASSSNSVQARPGTSLPASSLADEPNNSTFWGESVEQGLADLKRPWNCLGVGMWHSLFTFLELQPGLPDVEQLKMEQSLDQSYHSMGWMLGYRVAVLLELIVAYFHLGLLVSVLYRHITRRSP